MQLYIKVIPVKAGTSVPVGDPLMIPCPPDVEPDTLLSFLTQKLGEVIDTAWTATDRHPRINAGWVFPGMPATESEPATDFVCVPQVRVDDGTLQPMFELLADQRQEFEELATSGAFDTYTVIQQSLREYQPSRSLATETTQHDASHAERSGQKAIATEQVHATLTQIARETGAALHAYPRPGRAVRRILLRDLRDDQGTQFEVAEIEDDGTLRIIGHDQGPGVSKFFGEGITSYEWIYTIAPDRIDRLVTLTGGQRGGDVLDALAAYYDRMGGRINDLLQNPEVRADFSNWHS